MNTVDVREAVTQAHHEEWARVVASLTRRFGDLDIAEEAAAEAFAAATSSAALTRRRDRFHVNADGLLRTCVIGLIVWLSAGGVRSQCR